MKYLLLAYGNEQAMRALSKETMDQALAAYAAYREALTKAGVLLGANRLQPVWSQPRVKVVTYADALGHSKNRIKGIAAELGLTVPANLAS